MAKLGDAKLVGSNELAVTPKGVLGGTAIVCQCIADAAKEGARAWATNAFSNLAATGIMVMLLFAERHSLAAFISIIVVYLLATAAVVASAIISKRYLPGAPSFVSGDMTLLLWTYAFAVLDSTLAMMHHAEVETSQHGDAWAQLGLWVYYAIAAVGGFLMIPVIAFIVGVSYLRRCHCCRTTALACVGCAAVLELARFFDPLALAVKAPRLLAVCVECGVWCSLSWGACYVILAAASDAWRRGATSFLARACGHLLAFGGLLLLFALCACKLDFSPTRRAERFEPGVYFQWKSYMNMVFVIAAAAMPCFAGCLVDWDLVVESEDSTANV
jgi:hypothetical protein